MNKMQSPSRHWSGNAQSIEDKALDRFADVMIENITNMKNSDWRQPWFATNVEKGLPRNYDGRPYNGFNSAMLMLYSNLRKFNSPVFITSSKVESLNFKLEKGHHPIPLLDNEGNRLPFVHIMKGEKSFPVIFHLPFAAVNKESNQRISIDDYSNMSDQQQKDYKLLVTNRVYSVFNIDQTNLKEARPEEYEKVCDNKKNLNIQQGPLNDFPAMDKIIQDQKWICPIKTDSTRGCYFSPSINQIAVPPKEQFKDGDYFYTSLFHEMAHSTGHPSQLNRSAIVSGEGMGSNSYGREELVAELTAALVGTRYGLAKHIKEDSCIYLKGWLQNIREEPQFLKSTLSDVKNAADLINKHIDMMTLKLDNSSKEIETTNEGSPSDKPDIEDDDKDKLDIQSEDSLQGVDIDGNGTIDKFEVFSSTAPDKRQGANESHEKIAESLTHHSFHR